MAKKDLEKNKAEQKRKSSRAKTSVVDEDKVNFVTILFDTGPVK